MCIIVFTQYLVVRICRTILGVIRVIMGVILAILGVILAIQDVIGAILSNIHTCNIKTIWYIFSKTLWAECVQLY